MTSKEIVKRCIEFRDPPRLGLDFQTAPIQGRVWDEIHFMVKAYSQPETVGMTVPQAERQYRAFKRVCHYPLIPYEGTR